MPTNFKRRMEVNYKHLMSGVATPRPKRKSKTKLVVETYKDELEKVVKRMNKEGKADQVVQFITGSDDSRDMHEYDWTTVILRVPA